MSSVALAEGISEIVLVILVEVSMSISGPAQYG